jgi:hypothetical protein
MPARDYGPPPGLTPVALSIWAIKQLERATCEGEIRAGMRVILADDPHKPIRSFIRAIRQRLLDVGAAPPDPSQ